MLIVKNKLKNAENMGICANFRSPKRKSPRTAKNAPIQFVLCHDLKH